MKRAQKLMAEEDDEDDEEEKVVPPVPKLNGTGKH
jgi:hypothetical protein